MKKIIMNKILIENDIINNSNNGVFIKDNYLTFKEDGEYNLEYINCSKIDFIIELESNINIKLFIYSENNDISINNHIILNENSNLLIYKFYSNKQVIENIQVDLNKPNSKINYCFSNIVSGTEDYHFIINHNANNTVSNISNKSITINNSKIDFVIDSNVIKNTSNCILNQATRIITMGEQNATVKPNMFIDKYDVEAKHSSVIGRFKEEDIFYLMTRGISKNDSIKLLIKGFIFSHLIINIEERAKILNIINANWR